MIRLPASVARTLRAHGEADYPEECCGLLLGRTAVGTRWVEAAVPVANARTDERRRRFLITAEDYRRAERTAAERELLLLGFYHSHPDHPARPSAYDLEHALPWHSYVVLAVEEGRAAACTSWILAEDRGAFLPEELVEEAESAPR